MPRPARFDALSSEAGWQLQRAGGDDYELCFTIAPESETTLPGLSRSAEVELTVIGAITEDSQLMFRAPGGERFEPGILGYQHFGGQEAGSR
jgi:thiamine-monophosphate kinase